MLIEFCQQWAAHSFVNLHSKAIIAKFKIKEVLFAFANVKFAIILICICKFTITYCHLQTVPDSRSSPIFNVPIWPILQFWYFTIQNGIFSLCPAILLYFQFSRQTFSQIRLFPV